MSALDWQEWITGILVATVRADERGSVSVQVTCAWGGDWHVGVLTKRGRSGTFETLPGLHASREDAKRAAEQYAAAVRT